MSTVPANVLGGVLTAAIIGAALWLVSLVGGNDGSAAQPEPVPTTTTPEAIAFEDPAATSSTVESATTTTTTSTTTTSTTTTTTPIDESCVNLFDLPVIAGPLPALSVDQLAGGYETDAAFRSNGEDVTFLLEGAYTTLTMTLGVPPDLGGGYSEAHINADARSVWSANLEVRDGHYLANLDVTGINHLQLDTHRSNPVIWADAQVCGENPPTIEHALTCTNGTSLFDLPLIDGPIVVPESHQMANRFTADAALLSDGADWTYLLEGAYTTLSLVIGVPGDSTGRGTAKIHGDGTTMWSDTVGIGNGTLAVNLPVAGINQLSLDTSSTGPILWADAQVCGENPPTTEHGLSCTDGTSLFDLPLLDGAIVLTESHKMANRFTPEDSLLSYGEDWTYQLDGSYTTLSLVVGVPVDYRSSSSAWIHGDRTRIWAEGMSVGSGTFAVNLDVTGMEQLQLETRNSGGIIWADAKLCP